MRELHVVAVSEDGRHVELAATKGASQGTHRVRLDARLVAAVRGELRSGAERAADLSPKDIQARLRAGESVEKIAQSAGMAVTRVERFAGPVAGERARMIEGAREAFVVRGRMGRSSVAMGVAVDAALAAHARPDSTTWAARREEDGRWCVTVGWFSRGRAREASWWYEPHERSLVAVDQASAALGHQDASPAPARRRSTPRAVARPAAKAPGTAVATRPAKPAKPAARPAKPAAKPAKPAATRAKPAAKPAAKAAKPAKAIGAAKAPAKPAKPAVPAVRAPKPAAKTAKAARGVAMDAKPARSRGPAAPKAARPRLKVVPNPPTPRTATATDQRDGVRSRASVPGWADVLLGTTPGAER